MNEPMGCYHPALPLLLLLLGLFSVYQLMRLAPANSEL